MRPFYLFLSLLCILVLTGCGSEEEITAPAFSNVAASGSLGSATVLTAPSRDLIVTIAGNIDDFAATIVANSTASGEVPVAVNSSNGSWTFEFTPQQGTNIVTFTASDQRGNINQLVLTVRHDTIAPLVTAVKQGLDPLDSNISQLIVTFNEALLDTSLATALFSVDGGTPITAAPFEPSKPKTVTLPLVTALPAGPHQLTCSGIRDLATPDGNTVAVGYFFDFTIQ